MIINTDNQYANDYNMCHNDQNFHLVLMYNRRELVCWHIMVPTFWICDPWGGGGGGVLDTHSQLNTLIINFANDNIIYAIITRTLV